MADRVDLRKLPVLTRTVYCLRAALLWGLATAGPTPGRRWWSIGVAGGVVQIADSPARLSSAAWYRPTTCPARSASNGVVVNTARVVGPALAGVLIVTVGTTVCFGLNALSSLAVIAALLVIRPRKAGGPAPPGRRGVKEGLRYAAGGPPDLPSSFGSGACLAAVLAAFVHTPPNPDAALTDLAQ